jgi:anti-sigma28 factor (negative regulator of flagellin synthesis)
MRVENGKPFMGPAPEKRAEERKESAARRRPGAGEGRDDSVRISSRARELQGPRSELAPGELGPEARLETIRQRLEGGYYDTQEAVDALTKELTTIFGL